MMVLLSIEHLKASGVGGLTPAGRLSSWAAVVTQSPYSILAVYMHILYLNYGYTLIAI